METKTTTVIESKLTSEIAWYLGELLEATKTLANRHGTPLPLCHPHAQAALDRWQGTFSPLIEAAAHKAELELSRGLAAHDDFFPTSTDRR